MLVNKYATKCALNCARRQPGRGGAVDAVVVDVFAYIFLHLRARTHRRDGTHALTRSAALASERVRTSGKTCMMIFNMKRIYILCTATRKRKAYELGERI